MKLYVDELPKSCESCPCCNWDGDWGYDCNLADLDIQTNYDANTSEYDCDRQRHKDCPLQSLADYTKQVRKKVCEEIKSKLKSKERFHAEDDFEIDYDYYDKEDVDKILNEL